MSLRIPHDAECAVPGCEQKPTHILSLRMRRRDTGASWAPNTTAYFCDEHANSGSEIGIIYVPTKTGENVVNVEAVLPARPASRVTPIRP